MVVPVFKKGCRSHLNNYRPISLLSVFNKLLEKLMYNRMLNYLEQKHILYEKQFGFRAKHSTNQAILKLDYSPFCNLRMCRLCLHFLFWFGSTSIV